jgi:hypothetical protein
MFKMRVYIDVRKAKEIASFVAYSFVSSIKQEGASSFLSK